MQQGPPTIGSSSRPTVPGSTYAGRLELSSRRLRQLARKLLRRYPSVHGRDSLEDLLQQSVQRFKQAVDQARPTNTAEHMSVAGRCMRHELAELTRNYRAGRVSGQGSTQEFAPGATHPGGSPANAAMGETGRCAAWLAFHASVEQLPPEERQMFDFLWYHEVTPVEAAAALDTDERTLLRRWQGARLHLFDLLEGHLPPED